METCTHCRKAITDLESAHLWKERVVCGDCRATLAAGRTALLAIGGAVIVIVLLIAVLLIADGLAFMREAEEMRREAGKMQW